MRVRALIFVLAVVATAVAAGTVSEPAHAFRSPVNPVVLQEFWGVTSDMLDGVDDKFPCEWSNDCTDAQKKGIKKGRQGGKIVPKLRRLGRVGLYAGAFQVGWIIGSEIDGRWIHVRERVGGGVWGRTDHTPTTGNYTVRAVEWNFRQVGYVFSTGFVAKHEGWYLSFQSCAPSPCTPGGTAGPVVGGMGVVTAAVDGLGLGGTWVSVSTTGQQVAYMKEEEDAEDGTEMGPPEVYNPSDPEQETPNTSYGPKGRTLTSSANAGTNAPGTKPTYGSQEQQDASAGLKHDEPTAQAAAAAGNTQAESETSATHAGQAATKNEPPEGRWEGYPVGNFTMPDCRGLTVAQCVAALQAAGYIGTITQVELDIATADVTKPAGAVVTQSVGANTSAPKDSPLTLEVNPETMPFVLPAPLPGETYPQWLDRLRQLGFVGEVTVTELSETAGDPQLGPDAPVVVKTPNPVATQAPVVIRLPAWPGPTSGPNAGPRVEVDAPIEVWKNPPTYAPLPSTPGGGGATPELDFSPLVPAAACDKFPFGVFCWIGTHISLFGNTAAVPPSVELTFPSMQAGPFSIPAMDYGWDFNDLEVFDPYINTVRVALEFFLWLGGLYTYARWKIGRGAPGDESVAEVMLD